MLNNVVGNNIKCTGDTNGSVSFDVNNTYGTSVDVSYQVYEAFTNDPIVGASGTATIAPSGTLTVTDFGAPNLPVGTYYVLVREVVGPNVGCSVVSANFNIQRITCIIRNYCYSN